MGANAFFSVSCSVAVAGCIGLVSLHLYVLSQASESITVDSNICVSSGAIIACFDPGTQWKQKISLSHLTV